MNLPDFSSTGATGRAPFFLIAGPCVIESEALALSTAETLRAIADDLRIDLIYKSSFDKANRTSAASPRGPGATGVWKSSPKSAASWMCRC